jgi:hypothetical protein
MSISPTKVANYQFPTNTMVKDTRMTAFAIIAISTLPGFITINTDSKTYKVAPTFADLSSYPSGVTLSFMIEDRTSGSSFNGQLSTSSYSVTFNILNTQPTFSTLPTNLKICQTKLTTLEMPTAIDSEGHTITYSCTYSESFISYNSATKVISFAATPVKVTTPITLSLNAKDDELSTSGTTATLTVTHNAPP